MRNISEFYGSPAPDFCEDLQAIANYIFKTGTSPDLSLFADNHELFHPVEMIDSITNMRRAGHHIFFIRVGEVPLVFKFFADFGGHSLGRRIEFYLQNLVRDPAFKSYQNAVRLYQANVPALIPVAYISKPSFLSRKACFIYHMIKSSESAFDFLESDVRQEEKDQLMEKIASLVTLMEQANLYQPDFSLGNMLLADQGDGNLNPVIIDTDDILEAKFSRYPDCIRYRLVFFFLRRLKPNLHLSEVFIRKYMGSKYNSGWLKLWVFYRTGGFNFVKRIKKSIRGVRNDY
ncbi:lipopolysaccharide kinase InaA family protein [Marinospirillum sp.]|uniref:lipopolysaccharide kinase InaA family protein n=1 Tax=Marinospirillum sp. TaxID=2183934 RepID=UPI00286FEB5D|nr:lipopolysaccharide kinase InaA family protein [Marinospirillum sp.]MDR9469014.1 lipopolysaccharide kinase InaA family protein [Marinospirillum sp.]